MPLPETKGSVLSRLAYYAAQLHRRAILLEFSHFQSGAEPPAWIEEELAKDLARCTEHLDIYKALLATDPAPVHVQAAE